MRYFVEGTSIKTGEAIFGKAFEAENKAKAIDQARVEYTDAHSRQANMRIGFDAWEQPEFKPKY